METFLLGCRVWIARKRHHSRGEGIRVDTENLNYTNKSGKQMHRPGLGKEEFANRIVKNRVNQQSGEFCELTTSLQHFEKYRETDAKELID